LRLKKGWTRDELAERAGISSRTIQSWEQGVADPAATSLLKLAAVLGVSADEFAAPAAGTH
jgi:transcriptional regulator with XRE-family HTH domain